MSVVSRRGALEQARTRLKEAGVPEPAATAEFWMAHLLGVSRPEVRMEGRLRLAVRRSFFSGIERMATERRPLAYEIGNQPFLNLSLKLRHGKTLIPRAETENLAAMTVDLITRHFAPGKPLNLADIGTGTGCLALGLWMVLRTRNPLKVWATDNSSDALAVSRLNARHFGAPKEAMVFRCGSLFNPLPKGPIFDIVVSNPPYVKSGDWEKLNPEIRLWEPREALDGGFDGLRLIRPLIRQARLRLKGGGFLMLEFGKGQGPAIRRLARAGGFLKIEFFRDFNGILRYGCFFN